MPSRLLAAAFVLLAAPSAPAAVPPAIDVQSFELAAGADDGILARSARRQDRGNWSRSWHLLAGLHYTRKPLVFANHRGAELLTEAVVGDLWMFELGASVGLRGWTFEAILPVAPLIRGGGPDLVQVGRVTSPAFGDLRLAARRWLWGRGLGGLGRLDLGALLGYAPGTAARGSWLGSGGEQLDLMALASWRGGRWRADLNLGLRLRGRAELVVVVVDPQTGLADRDAAGRDREEVVLSTGSLGMLRAFAARSLAGGRANAGAGLQLLVPVGEVSTGQQLFELYADGSWRLDEGGAWRVFGALSTAPTRGYGSAAVRLLAGLRLRPGQLPGDRDGDGLDDRDDGCPDRAEDRDGFEDGDGCPDPDNDGDGVADRADRCPLRAEDHDGFEDDDGCPDPDNDGDGVLDREDKCPLQAEDRDGFDDRDGCPDPDNDGDGVPDKDDLCPNKAENRNGYDDQDGCPDLGPSTEAGGHPSQRIATSRSRSGLSRV